MVLLLFDTGLRLRAALSIERGNVDLSTGWLSVLAETQKQKVEEKHRVTMQTTDALRAIWLPPRGLLFPWPFEKKQVWPKLREILRRAGLPTTRRDLFHKFRRTTASHIAAKAGIDAAARQLGHSSTDMTVRYIDPRIARAHVDRRRPTFRGRRRPGFCRPTMHFPAASYACRRRHDQRLWRERSEGSNRARPAVDRPAGQLGHKGETTIFHEAERASPAGLLTRRPGNSSREPKTGEFAMIPIRFEKERAEYILSCLKNGSPIRPANPKGWSVNDILLLAGACLSLGVSHGPLLYGYSEADISAFPEERQEALLHDLHAAIEWFGALTQHVVCGSFDQNFESPVELRVTQARGDRGNGVGDKGL